MGRRGQAGDSGDERAQRAGGLGAGKRRTRSQSVQYVERERDTRASATTRCTCTRRGRAGSAGLRRAGGRADSDGRDWSGAAAYEVVLRAERKWPARMPAACSRPLLCGVRQPERHAPNELTLNEAVELAKQPAFGHFAAGWHSDPGQRGLRRASDGWKRVQSHP